ncbi:DUF1127 domain-containing protein [Planktotalea sp.]|uniref:DUF1127 domain-containing protein n=1 Tax=Planktotalea sp. TaxID=2029877 RepID=UPI00329A1EDA
MAFFTDTVSVNANQASFADKFAAVWTQVQEARAARAVYKKTVSELSALSGRELADLGLSYANIRSVAYEAAYGAK